MSLCDDCNGACCWYSIIAPKKNFDQHTLELLRLKKGVFIIEEFVAIKNKCNKLNDDFKCTIYPDRPFLCKKFAPYSRECAISRKLEGF